MNGVEYVQVNLQRMIYLDVVVVMLLDIKVVKINSMVKLDLNHMKVLLLSFYSLLYRLYLLLQMLLSIYKDYIVWYEYTNTYISSRSLFFDVYCVDEEYWENNIQYIYNNWFELHVRLFIIIIL